MKNNRQKIHRLQMELARYVARPAHIEFTDSYNETYVGVSTYISFEVGGPILRPICPISIGFNRISRTKIIQGPGYKRYTPVIEGSKKDVVMHFDIVFVETVTINKLEKLHARMEDRPRECLIISWHNQDFNRFNNEILGINIPVSTQIRQT
jgi:hypothetical protein